MKILLTKFIFKSCLIILKGAKNNIHTLMQQIKSLAVFDMESEKFNQCYDFIVKINV